MADVAKTAKITLPDLNPDDKVTSRQIKITVAGVELPVTEGIAGPVTVPGNPGDTITAQYVDYNELGGGVPSQIFTARFPSVAAVPRELGPPKVSFNA